MRKYIATSKKEKTAKTGYIIKKEKNKVILNQHTKLGGKVVPLNSSTMYIRDRYVRIRVKRRFI